MKTKIIIIIQLGFVLAATLHVPGTYPLIQNAIEVAADGDSILVAPGRYSESIDFSGKAIVLVSSYQKFGDERMKNTILDGKGSSVVRFENQEGRMSVLAGFTISGGKGTAKILMGNHENHSYGGGIFIKDASPSLRDLILIGNVADEGGGIFALNSRAILENIILENNSAPDGWGGGIICHDCRDIHLQDLYFIANKAFNGGAAMFANSNPKLLRCKFSGNKVEGQWGQAAAVFVNQSNPIFANCTFMNNHSKDGGAVVFNSRSNGLFLNSILWNNQPTAVYLDNNNGSNTLLVTYSCIEGGQSAIVKSGSGRVDWLEGNISKNPKLNEPENHDLRLQRNSPCINAGVENYTLNGHLILDESQYMRKGKVDMGFRETGFYTAKPKTDKPKRQRPSKETESAKLEPEAQKINKELVVQQDGEEVKLSSEAERKAILTLNDLGLEMVFIPGGKFKAGDIFGDGEADESNRDVALNGFYLSKTEITYAQYDEFCEFTNRPKVQDNGWGRGSFPVVYVNYEDAIAYCEWLSDILAVEIRLPRQSEWEYAARSGGKEEKWSGVSREDEVDDYLWHRGNSAFKPAEVAKKSPNGLNLYDMSGGVWEWAEWDSNPDSVLSIMMGGSRELHLKHTRCSNRATKKKNYSDFDIGFRICLPRIK